MNITRIGPILVMVASIIIVAVAVVPPGFYTAYCVVHQSLSCPLDDQGCRPIVLAWTLARNSSRNSQPAMNAPRPRVIGDFSNIKHVGDHSYGYALELWQQGTDVFGLFRVHNGLTGDSPTGLLDDVSFSPETKQLSFKTKLSTGLISKGNYREEPSRDVFIFKGTLSRGVVKGVIEISNALFPNEPATRKSITLTRSASMTQVMIAPTSHAAWTKWADEILKRLGPKW